MDAAVEKVTLPAHELGFKVLRAPLPPTVPFKVNIPAPPIVLSLANVTIPDEVLEPEAVNAPIPPTPAPFRVNASIPILTKFKSSVAPFATIVPPAVVPRPELLVTL